jgi:hypothetical protein
MANKERIDNLLFNTTIGSLICGFICLGLFVFTFGIGYIFLGVMVLLHLLKKRDKGQEWGGGASGFGVVFLWPIVIILEILHGREEPY